MNQSGLYAIITMSFFIGLAGANPDLSTTTWTDITPTSSASIWVSDIQISRQDPSILYTCLGAAGMQKSTDGGTTWKVLQPTATTQFQNPSRVRVDPDNDQHLYMVCGVQGTGFYVSTNGGSSWFTPAGWANLMDIIHEDNIYNIAVDPTDFSHVLISFYLGWDSVSWYNYNSSAGIAESPDGGNTWIAHQPIPQFAGDHCYNVAFLYDPPHHQGDGTTWIFSNRSTGLWRTTDAAASWTQVSSSLNITRSQYYYASTGYVYGAANGTPIRSTNNGVTWTAVSGAPNNYYYCMCGDGNLMYTLPFSGGPILVSPETDGITWHAFNSQTFCEGANVFTYDDVGHIMYMAGKSCGLWALKVAITSSQARQIRRVPINSTKPQNVFVSRVADTHFSPMVLIREKQSGRVFDPMGRYQKVK